MITEQRKVDGSFCKPARDFPFFPFSFSAGGGVSRKNQDDAVLGVWTAFNRKTSSITRISTAFLKKTPSITPSSTAFFQNRHPKLKQLRRFSRSAVHTPAKSKTGSGRGVNQNDAV